MIENLWWAYIAVGIFLIIIEIFIPNFIIMWFGVSAIITAIPVYFGASTKAVILTYAISLLMLTTLVRKITINYFSKSSQGVKTNTMNLIGKTGIVSEEIDQIAATGRVRVGKEEWSAISHSNEMILKGEKILVHAIEGVKLIVMKESE